MKLRLIIMLMLIGGNLVEYSRDLVVFPYEYTLRREISRGI